MTVQQRRKDIVDLLEDDDRSIDLANRIDHCKRGSCNNCGDLCPVKARSWFREHAEKISNLLTSSAGRQPVLRLRCTKEVWARPRGELAVGQGLAEDVDWHSSGRNVPASLVGIDKALRRALDKMNHPRLVAVGMLDAWYGHDQWEIGASLVIVGAERSALYDALPAGYTIEEVPDVRKAIQNLFLQSRRPKHLPPLDAITKLSRRRRLEYLIWLAGLKANERLFRYGCDRYFNPLTKAAKPVRVKVRKPRPYPHHLTPYMFNNHPWGCLCRACGGPGKHHHRA
jgi:hypothetical protein